VFTPVFAGYGETHHLGKNARVSDGFRYAQPILPIYALRCAGDTVKPAMSPRTCGHETTLPNVPLRNGKT
jgi:hypothetical protein